MRVERFGQSKAGSVTAMSVSPVVPGFFGRRHILGGIFFANETLLIVASERWNGLAVQPLNFADALRAPQFALVLGIVRTLNFDSE